MSRTRKLFFEAPVDARLRSCLWFVALVLSVCLSATTVAAATELTGEQQARQRAVEQQLMAPCCFGGTVADHRSPLSDQIREEVRGLVLAGQSDKQILDYFLEKYGERILAAPRASGFNLLAWVMPVVGLALGAAIVGLFMAHHRRRPVSDESKVSAPVESYRNSVQQQFDRELDRFDV